MQRHNEEIPAEKLLLDLKAMLAYHYQERVEVRQQLASPPPAPFDLPLMAFTMKANGIEYNINPNDPDDMAFYEKLKAEIKEEEGKSPQGSGQPNETGRKALMPEGLLRPISLAQALEEFDITTIRQMSEKNGKECKNYLTALLGHFGPKTMVYEISSGQLTSWFIRDHEGKSQTYQKRKRSHLNKFFRHCKDIGAIHTDISEYIPLAQTKSAEKTPMLKYNKKQIEDLFHSDLFKNKWKAKHPNRYWAIILMYLTGARAGEICQLNNNDIDTPENCEELPEGCGLLKIRASGNQKIKTAQSRREVPLMPILNDLCHRQCKNDPLTPT